MVLVGIFPRSVILEYLVLIVQNGVAQASYHGGNALGELLIEVIQITLLCLLYLAGFLGDKVLHA